MTASVANEFTPKRTGTYASPPSSDGVLPVVYGTMTGGSDGLWECPRLSTTGYVYGAAGHAVQAEADGNTPAVYGKDGAPVPESDYAFNAAHDFEGRGVIASLTFIRDMTDAEPLSVRCRGRAQGGTVIVNPVDAVRDFLTQLAGFTEDQLNQTSFAQARTVAERQALRVSGLIDEARSVGSILSEMLFPFADWWLDREGRICLRVEAGPQSYSEADVVGCFPADGRSDMRIEADSRSLVNQVQAEYAYNGRLQRFEAWDDGSTTRDAVSQSLYGRRDKRFALKWVREAETVRMIQAGLTARFKDPPLIFRVSRDGFRHIQLERGDVAAVSAPWFYDRDRRPLANQLMKVLEVETDFIGGRMHFRLHHLGADLHLTQAFPADGSLSADGSSRAGGDRDRTAYTV